MEYLKQIEYPKDYFTKLHEYKHQVSDLKKRKEILLEKDIDINKKLLRINKEITKTIELTDVFVKKEQTKLITDTFEPSNILTILARDSILSTTRCSSCLKYKKDLKVHLRNNWVMSNDGVFCPKCVYHIQPKGLCIGINAKETCKKPEEFKIKIAICFLCKKDKMITKCIHTEKILRGVCDADLNISDIYDTILNTDLFVCTECIESSDNIDHFANHFKKSFKKGIYFNKYHMAPRVFTCGSNPFRDYNLFKYNKQCRLCQTGFYKNKYEVYEFFKNNVNIPIVLTNIIFLYFDKIDYVKMRLL